MSRSDRRIPFVKTRKARRGIHDLDTTAINEWGEHEDGFVVDGDVPDRRRIEVSWHEEFDAFVIEYQVAGHLQTIEIGRALAGSLSHLFGSKS